MTTNATEIFSFVLSSRALLHGVLGLSVGKKGVWVPIKTLKMNISQRISSIKRELIAKSDTKAKEAFRKFVPMSQRAYGVLVPFLNQIAKEHREGGFELAEALWKAGAFEEREYWRQRL